MKHTSINKLIEASIWIMISLGVISGLTGCGNQRDDGRHVKVYVYGDSISQGFGINGPTYLERIIPQLNGYMINKSHGGTSVLDGNPYGDASQYQVMISEAWETDAIIMWAPGVNDAILHGNDPVYLARYQQGLIDMVGKIHNSHNRAFIGTPNHTCDQVRFVTNVIVDEYAAINILVVNSLNDPNIKIIDYNQGFVPTTINTLDCYHLNSIGYQQMANFFLTGLL